LNFFAGEFDIEDARGNECAHGVAQVIEGEQEPFPVDVAEVVGVEQAGLGLAAAGLAVGHLQLPAAGGGLGQHPQFGIRQPCDLAASMKPPTGMFTPVNCCCMAWPRM